MKSALAFLLLALSLSACRGTAREDALHFGPWTFEEVQERTWRLVAMEGRGVASEARPTLNLLPDGAVNGNAGVNTFFGTWTREGETGLSFSELGTTLKAGPPELMDQERRMLSDLGIVDAWRVTGENLELRRGTHTLLRFVPTKP